MAPANSLHGSVAELADEGVGRPGIRSVHKKEQIIPIIDIAGLSDDRRAQVMEEIGRACEEWGCFQVMHHGVPQVVVDRTSEAARKFHEQPPEFKKKMASTNPDLMAGVNYMSANSYTGSTDSWLDILVIRCRSGQCDGFQDAPEIFKGSLLEYRREMQKLGGKLYKAIFESLGLSENYLNDALPNIDRVALTANFYPPCSDPRITSGFREHTDVGTLTILAQDAEAALQVRSKTGEWVTVEPHPHVFVVLLADQIEILTNRKYKSAEHRVLRITERARMSLPFTFGPTEETVIAPLSNLIDHNHPAVYKGVVYKDYMKNYFDNNVPLSRKGLNYAKASP